MLCGDCELPNEGPSVAGSYQARLLIGPCSAPPGPLGRVVWSSWAVLQYSQRETRSCSGGLLVQRRRHALHGLSFSSDHAHCELRRGLVVESSCSWHRRPFPVSGSHQPQGAIAGEVAFNPAMRSNAQRATSRVRVGVYAVAAGLFAVWRLNPGSWGPIHTSD